MDGASRIHQRVLTGVVFCLLLGGCSPTYFVPMELAPFRTTHRQTAETPYDEPRLLVQTHPDGLGWTVSVRQPWKQTKTEEEEEVWNGFQYQTSPTVSRQILLSLATPITCPGSVLARLIGWGWNLFGVIEGPEPTWKTFYGYCVVPLRGLDPATATWTSRTQDTTSQHTFTSVTEETLTEGRIQLQWISPTADPIVIEYPLSPDRQVIDIRLRDLATVIQRDRIIAHLRKGQVQLAYLSYHTSNIATPLPVTSHTLDVATRSTLVRRPQSEWPAHTRIRIASSHADLTQLAERTISHLHLPLVLRGADLHALTQTQQQEASPLFTDQSTPTIGHWTGATVLLSLQSTPQDRTHQYVQITAIEIETGLVLGHVTLERPNTITPEFEGLFRGELEGLLTTPTRRQGTVIEERR